MKCWGIVPAAGRGRRMNGGVPKQYIEIGGARIIDHSIAALLGHPAVQSVVVALSPGDDAWRGTRFAGDPRIVTCRGGDSRARSVANALAALSERAGDDDWVAVHDAVRPCLRAEDFDRLLCAVGDEPAGGILVAPLSDTLKQAGGGYVERTLDRNLVVRALTPQVFRYRLLCDVMTQALANGVSVDDEASAVERAGYPVRTVVGDAGNVKVTYPADLRSAEADLNACTDDAS